MRINNNNHIIIRIKNKIIIINKINKTIIIEKIKINKYNK